MALTYTPMTFDSRTLDAIDIGTDEIILKSALTGFDEEHLEDAISSGLSNYTMPNGQTADVYFSAYTRTPQEISEQYAISRYKAQSAKTFQSLTTEVANSSGGGGFSDITVWKGYDHSAPPETLQVASTLAPVDGTVYNKGDIFIATQRLFNVEHYLCIAVKDFTWSDDKGVGFHRAVNELWHSGRALGVVNTINTGDWPVATSANIEVHGCVVSVHGITFDIDVNDASSTLATAGTPLSPSMFEGITPLPWKLVELYNTQDKVCFMYGDDDAFLRPGWMGTIGSVENGADNKLDTKWVYNSGVTLGYMDSIGNSADISGGGFAVNGAVVPVGSLDLFSDTPLNDGDPVYQINTFSRSMIIGTDTWLSPTPVDADTIQIGTYSTANGGELTIGIS